MKNRLQEIAAYTGLSESTVSRVLNERKGVAAATRESVLTAVDVLGYERPSALKNQHARLVGIFMPEFGNPSFLSVAEVIGSQLTQRGFTPWFGVTESAGPPESQYVEALLDRQAAGMVFISGLHAVEGYEHGHYEVLVRRKVPTVVVNGIASGLPIQCVSTDDAQAVELAVRHLVDLGHRTIGLAISDQEHVPAARKVRAFTALIDALPGVEGRVDRSIYTLEGGSAAASRLIEHGVTGIVCASDTMALGAVRAAAKLGLAVPRDISVVGYDDSTMMSLVHPALTTIRQPTEALGKAAAGLLAAQIAGTGPKDASEILYEPELVVRQTTGPAPAK